MTNPTARIIAPLAVGALAAAGAIAGSIIGTRLFARGDRQLGRPQQPLPFDGWWNQDSSSGLAHAHPAVLFVDAVSGAVVDSWDRRTRARVERPAVQRTGQWPAHGLLVLDASTGDLLGTVQDHAPAAE